MQREHARTPGMHIIGVARTRTGKLFSGVRPVSPSKGSLRTCAAEMRPMTSCAPASISCSRLVADRGALEVACVGWSCFATTECCCGPAASARDCTTPCGQGSNNGSESQMYRLALRLQKCNSCSCKLLCDLLKFSGFLRLVSGRYWELSVEYQKVI